MVLLLAGALSGPTGAAAERYTLSVGYSDGSFSPCSADAASPVAQKLQLQLVCERVLVRKASVDLEGGNSVSIIVKETLTITAV
jgi:hypothetical protein